MPSWLLKIVSTLKFKEKCVLFFRKVTAFYGRENPLTFKSGGGFAPFCPSEFIPMTLSTVAFAMYFCYQNLFWPQLLDWWLVNEWWIFRNRNSLVKSVSKVDQSNVCMMGKRRKFTLQKVAIHYLIKNTFCSLVGGAVSSRKCSEMGGNTEGGRQSEKRRQKKERKTELGLVATLGGT